MRALLLALLALMPPCALSQQRFDVVSIHMSSGEVQFERDGETVLSPSGIRMRDVTVSTCIKLAYNVQQPQILGPEGMDRQHYDITARSDEPVTLEQVRAMLRQVLDERFALKLHRGSKEMDAYVLTVAPSGLKMKVSERQDGEPTHQNSAMGMVAHNFSLQDLADYVSGPLSMPLIDETHLPGRYDFTIDFHPYVDNAPDIHADPAAVLRATFQGELGLRMVKRRVTVETLVVDHIAEPTPN